jgi:hypothetical protein
MKWFGMDGRLETLVNLLLVAVLFAGLALLIDWLLGP